MSLHAVVKKVAYYQTHSKITAWYRYILFNESAHTHMWKVSEHSCTWTISSVKLIQAGICAVWSVYPLVVWLNKLPFMEGFGNSCDYEVRRCLISPVSESHSNTHALI